MSRALFSTFLVVVLVSLPMVANAQTAPATDNSAEARSLFERGVMLSAQERWGEALDFFVRSRALVERPNTVFNLASTLIRLGRLIEARTALQDFLRLSDGTRDAASRADAQRMMDSATTAIGTLALAVSPPDAEVRIDGRLTTASGAARAIELDPGAHTITTTRRGYIDATQTLSVGQAERLSRAISLAPVTTTGSISVTATPANAVLRIDGHVVGMGSYSDALAPGPHVVEITADGYESTRRQVLIVRGDNMVVQAAWSRQSSVFSSPAFWGTTGGIVAAGVVVTILAIVLTPATYERGSTGTLISEPQ